VTEDIRPGHKVARRARQAGEPVRRYGQVIGFATRDIGAGEHVHTQNLAVGELSREYEIGVDVTPVSHYPPAEMRYFDGYLREDGRVGTRNYVAVVSTVNCSASVSQFVKQRFADVARDYPHVDWAGHARSLGCLAEDVAGIGELEEAFARARAADRTSVLVIHTAPHDWTPGGAFWEVGVPEESQRAEVSAARGQVAEGTSRQRRGI